MRIKNLINSNKDFISFEELALIATLRPNDERGTASDVIMPDLKLPIVLFEKNKIKYINKE